MFIHFWHFCLAEGLGVKLQDMAQYLRSIIPSEEVPEFDPPESKFTSVAILCPINFSKASSPSTLGHWISGWLSSELDDADALAHRWLTESSNVETATLSDLEAKLSMEKDEVLRKSLLGEIKVVETRMFNRVEMFRDLHEIDGIVAKDCICDGNCAVDMLNNFKKTMVKGPMDLVTSAHGVRMEEIAEGRQELRALWKSVSSDLGWQDMWKHVCRGHVDLKEWLKTHEPRTPPKQRGRRKLAFTPDDPSQTSPRVLPKVPSPASKSIVIPGAEAASEPPQKKRRTGKPLPLDQRVNFHRYFMKYLTDLGVTYRSWFAEHKREHVVLYLVG